MGYSPLKMMINGIHNGIPMVYYGLLWFTMVLPWFYRDDHGFIGFIYGLLWFYMLL